MLNSYQQVWRSKLRSILLDKPEMEDAVAV